MYTRLVTGSLQVNTYLIEDQNEVAVIDPGDDVEKIFEKLDDKNLTVKYILLTHGHGDHIGVVDKIRDKYPDLEVVAHKDELELLLSGDKNLSTMIFGREIVVKPDVLLEDGDELTLGSKKIKVLHTPGHSPGGVVYLVDNLAFTGDTIFRESIGRSDFYKGDQDLLIRSIKEKILTLDEDTILLPGHGPVSTVAHERYNNLFIR